MTPHLHFRTLVRQYFRKYGTQNGVSELRWMNWHKVRHENPARAVEMLQRRLRDEPLAYILGIVLAYTCLTIVSTVVREGNQPFGGLEIVVRPPVLIPRPETEDWTLRLAERI